jgi:hypothetical protein
MTQNIDAGYIVNVAVAKTALEELQGLYSSMAAIAAVADGKERDIIYNVKLVGAEKAQEALAELVKKASNLNVETGLKGGNGVPASPLSTDGMDALTRAITNLATRIGTGTDPNRGGGGAQVIQAAEAARVTATNDSVEGLAPETLKGLRESRAKAVQSIKDLLASENRALDGIVDRVNKDVEKGAEAARNVKGLDEGGKIETVLQQVKTGAATKQDVIAQVVKQVDERRRQIAEYQERILEQFATDAVIDVTPLARLVTTKKVVSAGAIARLETALQRTQAELAAATERVVASTATALEKDLEAVGAELTARTANVDGQFSNKGGVNTKRIKALQARQVELQAALSTAIQDAQFAADKALADQLEATVKQQEGLLQSTLDLNGVFQDVNLGRRTPATGASPLFGRGSTDPLVQRALPGAPAGGDDSGISPTVRRAVDSTEFNRLSLSLNDVAGAFKTLQTINFTVIKDGITAIEQSLGGLTGVVGKDAEALNGLLVKARNASDQTATAQGTAKTAPPPGVVISAPTATQVGTGAAPISAAQRRPAPSVAAEEVERVQRSAIFETLKRLDTALAQRPAFEPNFNRDRTTRGEAYDSDFVPGQTRTKREATPSNAGGFTDRDVLPPSAPLFTTRRRTNESAARGIIESTLQGRNGGNAFLSPRALDALIKLLPDDLRTQFSGDLEAGREELTSLPSLRAVPQPEAFITGRSQAAQIDARRRAGSPVPKTSKAQQDEIERKAQQRAEKLVTQVSQQNLALLADVGDFSDERTVKSSFRTATKSLTALIEPLRAEQEQLEERRRQEAQPTPADRIAAQTELARVNAKRAASGAPLVTEADILDRTAESRRTRAQEATADIETSIREKLQPLLDLQSRLDAARSGVLPTTTVGDKSTTTFAKDAVGRFDLNGLFRAITAVTIQNQSEVSPVAPLLRQGIKPVRLDNPEFQGLLAPEFQGNLSKIARTLEGASQAAQSDLASSLERKFTTGGLERSGRPVSLTANLEESTDFTQKSAPELVAYAGKLTSKLFDLVSPAIQRGDAVNKVVRDEVQKTFKTIFAQDADARQRFSATGSTAFANLGVESRDEQGRRRVTDGLIGGLDVAQIRGVLSADAAKALKNGSLDELRVVLRDELVSRIEDQLGGRVPLTRETFSDAAIGNRLGTFITATTAKGEPTPEATINTLLQSVLTVARTKQITASDRAQEFVGSGALGLSGGGAREFGQLGDFLQQNAEGVNPKALEQSFLEELSAQRGGKVGQLNDAQVAELAKERAAGVVRAVQDAQRRLSTVKLTPASFLTDDQTRTDVLTILTSLRRQAEFLTGDKSLKPEDAAIQALTVAQTELAQAKLQRDQLEVFVNDRKRELSNGSKQEKERAQAIFNGTDFSERATAEAQAIAKSGDASSPRFFDKRITGGLGTITEVVATPSGGTKSVQRPATLEEAIARDTAAVASAEQRVQATSLIASRATQDADVGREASRFLGLTSGIRARFNTFVGDVPKDALSKSQIEALQRVLLNQFKGDRVIGDFDPNRKGLTDFVTRDATTISPELLNAVIASLPEAVRPGIQRQARLGETTDVRSVQGSITNLLFGERFPEGRASTAARNFALATAAPESVNQSDLLAVGRSLRGPEAQQFQNLTGDSVQTAFDAVQKAVASELARRAGTRGQRFEPLDVAQRTERAPLSGQVRQTREISEDALRVTQEILSTLVAFDRGGDGSAFAEEAPEGPGRRGRRVANLSTAEAEQRLRAIGFVSGSNNALTGAVPFTKDLLRNLLFAANEAERTLKATTRRTSIDTVESGLSRAESTFATIESRQDTRPDQLIGIATSLRGVAQTLLATGGSFTPDERRKLQRASVLGTPTGRLEASIADAEQKLREARQDVERLTSEGDIIAARITANPTANTVGQDSSQLTQIRAALAERAETVSRLESDAQRFIRLRGRRANTNARLQRLSDVLETGRNAAGRADPFADLAESIRDDQNKRGSTSGLRTETTEGTLASGGTVLSKFLDAESFAGRQDVSVGPSNRPGVASLTPLQLDTGRAIQNAIGVIQVRLLRLAERRELNADELKATEGGGLNPAEVTTFLAAARAQRSLGGFAAANAAPISEATVEKLLFNTNPAIRKLSEDVTSPEGPRVLGRAREESKRGRVRGFENAEALNAGIFDIVGNTNQPRFIEKLQEQLRSFTIPETLPTGETTTPQRRSQLELLKFAIEQQLESVRTALKPEDQATAFVKGGELVTGIARESGDRLVIPSENVPQVSGVDVLGPEGKQFLTETRGTLRTVLRALGIGATNPVEQITQLRGFLRGIADGNNTTPQAIRRSIGELRTIAPAPDPTITTQGRTLADEAVAFNERTGGLGRLFGVDESPAGQARLQELVETGAVKKFAQKGLDDLGTVRRRPLPPTFEKTVADVARAVFRLGGELRIQQAGTADGLAELNSTNTLNLLKVTGTDVRDAKVLELSAQGSAAKLFEEFGSVLRGERATGAENTPARDDLRQRLQTFLKSGVLGIQGVGVVQEPTGRVREATPDERSFTNDAERIKAQRKALNDSIATTQQLIKGLEFANSDVGRALEQALGANLPVGDIRAVLGGRRDRTAAEIANPVFNDVFVATTPDIPKKQQISQIGSGFVARESGRAQFDDRFEGEALRARRRFARNDEGDAAFKAALAERRAQFEADQDTLAAARGSAGESTPEEALRVTNAAQRAFRTATAQVLTRAGVQKTVTDVDEFDILVEKLVKARTQTPTGTTPAEIQSSDAAIRKLQERILLEAGVAPKVLGSSDTLTEQQRTIATIVDGLGLTGAQQGAILQNTPNITSLGQLRQQFSGRFAATNDPAALLQQSREALAQLVAERDGSFDPTRNQRTTGFEARAASFLGADPYNEGVFRKVDKSTSNPNTIVNKIFDSLLEGSGVKPGDLKAQQEFLQTDAGKGLRDIADFVLVSLANLTEGTILDRPKGIGALGGTRGGLTLSPDFTTTALRATSFARRQELDANGQVIPGSVTNDQVSPDELRRRLLQPGVATSTIIQGDFERNVLRISTEESAEQERKRRQQTETAGGGTGGIGVPPRSPTGSGSAGAGGSDDSGNRTGPSSDRAADALRREGEAAKGATANLKGFADAETIMAESAARLATAASKVVESFDKLNAISLAPLLGQFQGVSLAASELVGKLQALRELGFRPSSATPQAIAKEGTSAVERTTIINDNLEKARAFTTRLGTETRAFDAANPDKLKELRDLEAVPRNERSALEQSRIDELQQERGGLGSNPQALTARLRALKPQLGSQKGRDLLTELLTAANPTGDTIERILSGNDPETIRGLGFTGAGRTEVRDRVFANLGLKLPGGAINTADAAASARQTKENPLAFRPVEATPFDLVQQQERADILARIRTSNAAIPNETRRLSAANLDQLDFETRLPRLRTVERALAKRVPEKPEAPVPAAQATVDQRTREQLIASIKAFNDQERKGPDGTVNPKPLSEADIASLESVSTVAGLRRIERFVRPSTPEDPEEKKAKDAAKAARDEIRLANTTRQRDQLARTFEALGATDKAAELRDTAPTQVGNANANLALSSLKEAEAKRKADLDRQSAQRASELQATLRGDNDASLSSTRAEALRLSAEARLRGLPSFTEADIKLLNTKDLKSVLATLKTRLALSRSDSSDTTSLINLSNRFGIDFVESAGLADLPRESRKTVLAQAKQRQLLEAKPESQRSETESATLAGIVAQGVPALPQQAARGLSPDVIRRRINEIAAETSALGAPTTAQAVAAIEGSDRAALDEAVRLRTQARRATAAQNRDVRNSTTRASRIAQFGPAAVEQIEATVPPVGADVNEAQRKLAIDQAFAERAQGVARLKAEVGRKELEERVKRFAVPEETRAAIINEPDLEIARQRLRQATVGQRPTTTASLQELLLSNERRYLNLPNVVAEQAIDEAVTAGGFTSREQLGDVRGQRILRETLRTAAQQDRSGQASRGLDRRLDRIARGFEEAGAPLPEEEIASVRAKPLGERQAAIDELETRGRSIKSDFGRAEALASLRGQGYTPQEAEALLQLTPGQRRLAKRVLRENKNVQKEEAAKDAFTQRLVNDLDVPREDTARIEALRQVTDRVFAQPAGPLRAEARRQALAQQRRLARTGVESRDLDDRLDEAPGLAGLAQRQVRVFATDEAERLNGLNLIRRARQQDRTQARLGFRLNDISDALETASPQDATRLSRLSARTEAEALANSRNFASSIEGLAQNGRTELDPLRTPEVARRVAELREAIRQRQRFIRPDERLAQLNRGVADLEAVETRTPAQERRLVRLRTQRDETQALVDERTANPEGFRLARSEAARNFRTADANLRNTVQPTLGIKGLLDGSSFLENTLGNIQRILGIGLGTAATFGLVKGLKDAVTSALQLEEQLARVQGILRSRSGGEIQAIREGIFAQSVEFGVKPADVLANVQTFAQSGFTGQQAIEATSASIRAQIASGLTPQQATDLIIAVRNIGATRAENGEQTQIVGPSDIVDRISRIESTRAVTAQDLAQIIQRSAAITATLFGGSAGQTTTDANGTRVAPDVKQLGRVDPFDLTIGLGTAIVENTRVQGNQAATSLRFILSRLLAPDTQNALQKNFGIQLGTGDGTQLRPLIAILQDVSSKFQELTRAGDNERAGQLAQTIGGARQITPAIAILSNFDKVLETANESSLAIGDASERTALQLDTLGGQLRRTTAILTETIEGGKELPVLLKILARGLGAFNDNAQGATTLPGLGLGTAGVLGAVGATALSVGTKLTSPTAIALGEGALSGAARLLSPLVQGGLAVTSLFTQDFADRANVADDQGRRSTILPFSTGERLRLSSADLRQSDAFKSLQSFAESRGVGVTELQDQLNRAAQAVNTEFANPEVGDVTRAGGIRDRFVDELGTLLSNIPDEAERTAVALGLLANASRVNAAAFADQTQRLRARVNERVEQGRSQLDRVTDNAGTDESGVLGRVFGGGVASFLRERARRTRLENIDADAFISGRTGFQNTSLAQRLSLGITGLTNRVLPFGLTEQLALGGFDTTKSTLSTDSLEAADQVRARLGNASGGLTDFLSQVTVDGTSAFASITNTVLNGDKTLGQALDQLVETVFGTVEQQDRIAVIQAEILKKNPQISLVDLGAQTIAATDGDPGLQRVARSSAAASQAVARQLSEQFNIDGRFLGLTDDAARARSGGITGTQKLIDFVQANIDRALKQEIPTQQRSQLEQLSATLSRTDLAARTDLKVADKNARSGVRDVLLQALTQTGAQELEAVTFGSLAQGTGLANTTLQELVQINTGGLRRLSGVLGTTAQNFILEASKQVGAQGQSELVATLGENPDIAPLINETARRTIQGGGVTGEQQEELSNRARAFRIQLDTVLGNGAILETLPREVQKFAFALTKLSDDGLGLSLSFKEVQTIQAAYLKALIRLSTATVEAQTLRQGAGQIVAVDTQAQTQLGDLLGSGRVRVAQARGRAAVRDATQEQAGVRFSDAVAGAAARRQAALLAIAPTAGADARAAATGAAGNAFDVAVRQADATRRLTLFQAEQEVVVSRLAETYQQSTANIRQALSGVEQILGSFDALVTATKDGGIKGVFSALLNPVTTTIRQSTARNFTESIFTGEGALLKGLLDPVVNQSEILKRTQQEEEVRRVQDAISAGHAEIGRQFDPVIAAFQSAAAAIEASIARYQAVFEKDINGRVDKLQATAGTAEAKGALGTSVSIQGGSTRNPDGSFRVTNFSSPLDAIGQQFRRQEGNVDFAITDTEGSRNRGGFLEKTFNELKPRLPAEFRNAKFEDLTAGPKGQGNVRLQQAALEAFLSNPVLDQDVQRFGTSGAKAFLQQTALQFGPVLTERQKALADLPADEQLPALISEQIRRITALRALGPDPTGKNDYRRRLQDPRYFAAELRRVGNQGELSYRIDGIDATAPRTPTTTVTTTAPTAGTTPTIPLVSTTAVGREVSALADSLVTQSYGATTTTTLPDVPRETTDSTTVTPSRDERPIVEPTANARLREQIRNLQSLGSRSNSTANYIRKARTLQEQLNSPTAQVAFYDADIAQQQARLVQLRQDPQAPPGAVREAEDRLADFQRSRVATIATIGRERPLIEPSANAGLREQISTLNELGSRSNSTANFRRTAARLQRQLTSPTVQASFFADDIAVQKQEVERLRQDPKAAGGSLDIAEERLAELERGRRVNLERAEEQRRNARRRVLPTSINELLTGVGTPLPFLNAPRQFALTPSSPSSEDVAETLASLGPVVPRLRGVRQFGYVAPPDAFPVSPELTAVERFRALNPALAKEQGRQAVVTGLQILDPTAAVVQQNKDAKEAAEARGRLDRETSLRQARERALSAAAGLVGQIGGSGLGDLVAGGRSRFGETGASLGTAFGSAGLQAVAPALFKTLGNFGGPIGTVVGGLLGGLVGGLFGGTPAPPRELSSLERIERNTRETVTAIANQTAVLTLDQRLLNVPSSFRVPEFAPLFAGSGSSGAPQQTVQNVQITIQDARDPDKTAAAVSRELNQLYRSSGSYVPLG